MRLRCPGLYNVYNALAAAALALALGAPLDEVVAGLGALRRRVRPLRADRGRRPAAADAADQEPGRRERGGADARRRAARRALAVVALNDEIADGRDVSWIWDVDFEPLLEGLERVVATGARAAELALRFTYGGLAGDAIEVVPDLERALDRGARADARRAASSSSSPPTRRCSRCGGSSPSAATCARTGSARRERSASATSIPTT